MDTGSANGHAARALPGILLYGVLLFAALSFAQGLGGTFLFDDYENLEDLAWIAKDPGWGAALQYFATGFSSALGRPLALATFALQCHSWPDHPEDFLYVNLLLHVLNGALLCWALVRLQRISPALRGSALWPVLATALWLLTPVHTATTLYVVQRMAVLAATCMLGGATLYLAGRQALEQGREWRGYALMSGGMALGLGGVLAKENAVLFPLLLLVLEATVLSPPRSRWWQPWVAFALIAPVALAFMVLARRLPHYWSEVDRGFTLADRLLTEARVLFGYLRKFLFPNLYGGRLYYDDIVVSRSLFAPWITVVAVAGWAALAWLALKFRRRAAPFSLAVLWFLAAHLLESTVVPLEMAFDHRNYVALAGPAMALAWYCIEGLRAPPWPRLRPLFAVAAALYGLFLGAAAWQSNSFWGHPWEMMHYWGEVQPESRRSQIAGAKARWKAGRPDLAMELYERAAQRWPGDPMFLLMELELGCADPRLPVPEARRFEDSVRQFDGHVPSIINMLDTVVTLVEEKRCPRYKPLYMWNVVEAIFTVPATSAPQRQNHALLKSRIAELNGDRGPARMFLDEALRIWPRAPLCVQAGYWALQARDFKRAHDYLDICENDPSIEARERVGWERDLRYLDGELARLEAEALQGKDAPR